MKIVTGYRGIAHITSSDVGAFNASVFGDGQYVLDSGEKLKATVVSNGRINIGDGDILMNGRHITIDKGAIEELVFENNGSAVNRIDLVVCRYSKSSATGVENAELVIIKGATTTGTASEPSYNVGNILNGDEIVDMPLYRVSFTGITMGTPEAMFETLDSAVALKKYLLKSIENTESEMNTKLASHNHDSRYYTETEIDTKLTGKANSSHTHDDRYYTESEMNTKLAGKANSSHTHDDRYYTETESDKRYLFPVGSYVFHWSQTTAPFSYGTWECKGYTRMYLGSSQTTYVDPYIWVRTA